MNYSSGINYLYDFLGLDQSNFKIFYDFSSGSHSPTVINSISLGESEYSGVAGSVVTENNSGVFSASRSNLIKIQNVTREVFGGEFSLLFKFRTANLSSSQRVLFGSLTGGQYKSGFNVGINQANYPYFEYYDNSGPVILTSKNRLAETNILSVNIGVNNISIGRYDSNQKGFSEDNFFIDSNYLLFSDQWHLGGNILTGQPNQDFSGYFAGFLCFNTLIPRNISNRLASGFFSTVGQPSTTQTNLPFSEISGFSGQASTIKTSGFDSVFSNFTDNLYPAYNVSQQELDISSGEEQVAIYSDFSGLYQGDLPSPVLNIDKESLTEIGYDSIAYKWKDLESKYIEAYTNTGVIGGENLNKIANVDIVEGRFSSDDIYESGNLNAFLNGIIQIESGFGITGQFYNTGKNVISDFYLEGPSFVFKESGDETDVLMYDSNQFQNRILVNYSGQPSIDLGSNCSIYNLLFFNGQKIVSGVDYSQSGSSMVFSDEFNSIFSEVSGIMLAVSGFGGEFSRSTGSGSLRTSAKYLPNSTALYLNGVRHPPEHFTEYSFLSPLEERFIFVENISEINNNLIDDWT